jgi:hypothetical protein
VVATTAWVYIAEMRILCTCNPVRYIQGMLLVVTVLLMGCTAMYSLAHAKGEELNIQLANMSDEKLHDIYIITEEPRLGELLAGNGGWIAARQKPAGGGVSFTQDNEVDVPKHFIVKWKTPDGLLHKGELRLNIPEGKERNKYMLHRKRSWNIIIGFTEDGVTYGWTMTGRPTAENQYEPRPVVYGGSRELLIFTNWFLTPEEADSLPYWRSIK